MYDYRNINPHQDQRFFLFGAPFVGGLLGGLLGSALISQRPYPFYPPYQPYSQPFLGYPPYGGYGYPY